MGDITFDNSWQEEHLVKLSHRLPLSVSTYGELFWKKHKARVRIKEGQLVNCTAETLTSDHLYSLIGP